MTFYEAAVEVLRSAGRPLHVKKITELSVGQSLLTHVGREPEKTMAARLAQEIAKANGESLVRTVRPNVYELRDGADPSDAKQTVQLRSYEDVVEEPKTKEPVSADAESTESDDDQDAQEPSRNRRRSRRPRTESPRDEQRRNGRSSRPEREPRASKERNDSADSKPARNDNDASNDRAPQQRETPARTRREDAPTSQSRPRAARKTDLTAASPAAQKLARLRQQQETATPVEAAGDLAYHVRSILQDANEGMTLAEIGKALSETAYAALPKLPTAALHGTLTLANARRAAAGEAPLFKACTEGRWSLIEDQITLAQSFEALEQWQAQHQAQLVRRLEGVLAERDDEQLIGIVALVMERLGYVGLELHPAEGNELGTFSARLARGLSEERVAVRVFATDHPATRLDVMAFRGSLHQYAAARGVMFTLGGHSLCAREQIEVPNLPPIDLLHDGKLAELMVQTNVGTTTLEVSVASLDYAFFA